MIINEEIIENVLVRRKRLENDLKKRQEELIKKSQLLEKSIDSSFVLLKENDWIGEKNRTLSYQIKEEFYRQRKTVQEEMIEIQRQQAVITRIIICFESLPFTWREILELLYIQQQKWDSIELSRSTISYRKRKAMKQILEWYHSELTDLEIIQKGQGLMSGK